MSTREDHSTAAREFGATLQTENEFETSEPFATCREFRESPVPADCRPACGFAPLPLVEIVPEADPARTLGLVELILKDRPRLEAVIRRRPLQGELVPRFLAISLASFCLFGTAMALVFHAAGTWPALGPLDKWLAGGPPPIEFRAAGASLQHSAVALVAAYALGLIAATGVCLPSLYFYGLLAGVKMSFLDVTVHALKSKATAAVALVGILPMYAAIALGMVIFDVPDELRDACLLVGLALPFVAGLWGTRSLYVGFSGLCDTMAPEFRERRACFLRRLVFSWSAVYTAITPVMIFTLWQRLS
ncbi:MAG: hypothetical protein WED34_01215 [Planctomycetales bacterium]